MNARLKRLQPILELAESREKEAAQALGVALGKLEEARKGMSNLEGFRHDYGERFRRGGESGFSVPQLAEFRAFLGKIDQAVQDQEKVVENLRQEIETRRRAWQDAHGHTLGLQKLLEKIRAEETQREIKQEQKELDERAGRLNLTESRRI